MRLSIKEILKQDEFWVFIFILIIAISNWPILSAMEKRAIEYGSPSILVYIIAIWLLIILLTFLFDRGDWD